MHRLVKRIIKRLVRTASLFLPEERANDLERWRRGREDYWKYQRCDFVFASYGKSGRTWVRVMISRYITRAYDNIADDIVLGFDDPHKLNPDVPRIFFTHDNYLRRYTGNEDSRKDYYDRKTILLVRKPQDVAVSTFFQWKYRMRPYKKALNGFPPHGANVSVYDFVMHENQGLPRIIGVLNEWAAELDNFNELLVIRYEDLRSHPEQELTRLMEFLGEDVDPSIISDAVEFASVENMRKMETPNSFWRSRGPMSTTDTGNPDAFKVRKAKVGGYRDYFDDTQVAAIDAMVEDNLTRAFGYTNAEFSSRGNLHRSRGSSTTAVETPTART